MSVEAGQKGVIIRTKDGNYTFVPATATTSVSNPSLGEFTKIVTVAKSGSANYICSNYDNDDECIQAALDGCDSGDEIWIMPGTYTITHVLYQQGKNLIIKGIGDVFLSLENTDSPFGLHLCGVEDVSGNITVDASGNTITVDDASNIIAGDLIDVFNEVHWTTDYDATLSLSGHYGQWTGELYTVKDVSGNVVTLTEPLIRTYSTSDSPHFINYHPVSIHLENLNFLDSDDDGDRQAIALYYTKNVIIKECYVKDSGLAAINFYTTYNALVTECEIHNCLRSGSGYGVVAWAGTSFVKVINNHIENCRHTVSFNGAYYNTLNRGGLIENNTLIGADTAPYWTVVDTHTDVIDIVVRNNIIKPKTGNYCFNDRALHTTFEGNTINGGANGSVGGGIQSLGVIVDASTGCRIIRNNRFSNVDYAYMGKIDSSFNQLIFEGNYIDGGVYGIIVTTDYDEWYQQISVKNNEIHNVDYPVYIYLNADGTNVNISGNDLIGTDVTGVLLNGQTFTFGNVNVQNNYISAGEVSAGQGVRLTSVTYANVKMNTVEGNGSMAYGIYESGTSDYNMIKYNRVKSAGTAATYVIGANSVASDND